MKALSAPRDTAAAPTPAFAAPVAQARDELFSGRWLLAARIAFVALFALIVALNVIALPGIYASLLTPETLADLRRMGLSPSLYGALMLGQYALGLLPYLALGLLIFWRRSDNRMAWFCAVAFITFGGIALGPLDDINGSGSVLPHALASVPLLLVLTRALAVVGQMSIGIFFCLFPSGRFTPRWTRYLAAFSLVYWVISAFFPALQSGPFGTLLVICFVLTIVAQVYRYRRVSTADERAQTKWVVYGMAAAALIVVLVQIGFLLFVPESVRDAPERYPALANLAGSYWFVALAIIPICMTLAILRAHLWDIDLVINRTLVYGALTVCVVSFYVLVVGYLGALIHSGDNLLISLLATGLIALFFQPLRGWLQRGVNRLTYGQRDEPYAVVAQLGRRLETTLAPDAVLPAIVETVAQALKLPYAAIVLGQDGADARAVATYGAPVAGTLALPLTYQTVVVGQMLLGPRQRGEVFTPADRRLLDDLARQVGVAAHAVRLTSDLQRSREQLVTSREEERRRLRRDLHDGLGSTLTSLMFKLDAADTLLDSDMAEARALLEDVRGQMQSSIADIRRLVYDLRPPILDEWGLVAALHERVAQYALNDVQVVIEAPDTLPPLAAAVEVAAYRIALEALANVTKHARATQCVIRIALSPEALTLEISDDGVGRGAAPAGVGLVAMRERAAELGGSCVVEDVAPHGTRVRARLLLGTV
ncbi:MAG: hypothetical protein KGO05_04485 [Chloroflexota bacterium]|nr:hypothetical protein [Chloroflexota bacterium]